MSDTRVDFGSERDEDPFLGLGRAIAGLCPAGFEQAQLFAEFAAGGATLLLACIPAGGAETGIDIDPAAHDRLHGLLERIRAAPAGNGAGSWRKCTVTLRKGG